MHWCPGCGEMHMILTAKEDSPRWDFNGDNNNPTFTPSVRITGKQTIVKDGKWTGEWAKDANGVILDRCCHYFITNGQIIYCPDSTHALAGQIVNLPDIPEHLL